MSSGKRPKPEREICRIETFQDIAALSVQEALQHHRQADDAKTLPFMQDGEAPAGDASAFRRWGSLPASLQYDFNFLGYTGIDKQPVKLYSVAFNKDILVHELARAALSMSV